MANKLYEETNIQAIANAIRGKNGSSDTYTVAQMAQAIADIPTGGSMTIDNASLTQLKAENTTITPNKFVEITKTFSKTNLNASEEVSTCLIKLETNKVLVISAVSGALYYTVITIDNSSDVLDFSTVKSLSISPSGSTRVICFLENDRVYVFFLSPSSRIDVGIYSFDGTTLTHVYKTNIIQDTVGSASFKVEKADTGKYVVLYNRGSSYSYCCYGIVVEISGNTITAGTETQISSTSYSGYYLSTCQLDTNKILIRCSDSSYKMVGMILTISGTTITSSTGIDLDSNTYMYTGLFSKISSTKVLLSYLKNNKVNGKILDINNDTITVGTVFTITSISGGTSASGFGATDFVNGKAAVLFWKDTDQQVSVAFLSENNGTVSLLAEKKVTNLTSSFSGFVGLFYNEGSLLIKARNTNLSPAVRIMNTFLDNNNNINQTEKIVSASSKIDGLLVSEATTSTAGNVYILDV